MKVRLYTTSWFKGTPIQWNSLRFNGGDIYYVYRFFPILIQVRK